MWSFSQIYVVVFVVCSENKQVRSQTQRLLASLICSERAEFDDDSAVPLVPIAYFFILACSTYNIKLFVGTKKKTF